MQRGSRRAPLELAQSGRVGAKSVSAEDDYLAVAGVGEDVAAGVDVAAKEALGSDELGQRTLDLLSSSLSAQTLKSYAGRLSQFAEFCHDSENISPLEATTATVVRYVAWIGERGHIAAKSLQPYLSAINTFFEMHNLVPITKDSLHLTSARRGLMLHQRRLDAAPLRVPLPADVAYRFVTKAELIVSAPYPQYHLDFRALLASVVNFMFFARGLTGVSCRVRDVHVDTYNITVQVPARGREGTHDGDCRDSSAYVLTPGTNKWSLIIDLQNLTGYCKERKLNYEKLKKLKNVTREGDWMVSFDLEDGCYAFGVNEEGRDFFTMDYGGTFYGLASMPMGWRCSIYYFCKLAEVFV
eukprot:jgi/Tetstr1/439099/TSEL_002964.t1